MALVLSCDLEPVTVQAFGNWFSFKPGQVKMMEDRLASFLALEKRDMGFVVLPPVCEENPDSEEAKTAKMEKLAEGRMNIVRYLNGLINNLEVSLTSACERISETVPTSMKAMHLPHYRKLAALKAAEADADTVALNEIEKLKGAINGSAQRTDSEPSTNGRKAPTKSA